MDKTVVLRRSLKGNWGLFQKQIVRGGGYYTYPKCSCPHCTGVAHAKYNVIENSVWVALYVNFDKNNVLAWGKQFCMTVLDEQGNVLS